MIYILILLTTGTGATSSTGYEFTSLENCQKALAAVEELDGYILNRVHGVCVQK